MHCHYTGGRPVLGLGQMLKFELEYSLQIFSKYLNIWKNDLLFLAYIIYNAFSCIISC